MQTVMQWVSKKEAVLTALGGGLVYAAILAGSIAQLSDLAKHV